MCYFSCCKSEFLLFDRFFVVVVVLVGVIVPLFDRSLLLLLLCFFSFLGPADQLDLKRVRGTTQRGREKI